MTVTSACNQRCVHCLRSAAPARAEPLDLARLAPALESAERELHIARVVVSGGEPTLVPNLLELISVIDGLGIRPSLCTNATRIGSDRARRLAAAGLRSCTVGMEGVGEEYMWFRGGGTGGYGRALRGISALVASGISVTANITLHNRVLGQSAELARDLNGLGLASVSVTSPILQGRLGENLKAFSAVDQEAVERFADAMAAAMDCPVSLRTPRCNHSSCPSGQSVFSMDRYGRLGECPDVGSENVSELAKPIVVMKPSGG